MNGAGFSEAFPVLLLLPAMVLMAVMAAINYFGRGAYDADVADRARRAKERGWEYFDLRDADLRYRICGTSPDGFAWQVEYRCDHQSSAPRPNLRFTVPALRAPRLEWRIMSTGAYRLRTCAVGRTFISAGLQLASSLGADVDGSLAFFEQAGKFDAHTESSGSEFVLVGYAKWKKLLDAKLERTITTWPSTLRIGKFSAEMSLEGLVVSLGADNPDMAVIERLVHIGSALATRIADTTGPESGARLV